MPAERIETIRRSVGLAENRQGWGTHSFPHHRPEGIRHPARVCRYARTGNVAVFRDRARQPDGAAWTARGRRSDPGWLAATKSGRERAGGKTKGIHVKPDSQNQGRLVRIACACNADLLRRGMARRQGNQRRERRSNRASGEFAGNQGRLQKPAPEGRFLQRARQIMPAQVRAGVQAARGMQLGSTKRTARALAHPDYQAKFAESVNDEARRLVNYDLSCGIDQPRPEVIYGQSLLGFVENALRYIRVRAG